MWILLPWRHLLLLSLVVLVLVVVVGVVVVVMVVVVIVQVTAVVFEKSWPELVNNKLGKHIFGATAVKYKLGARAANHKLGARAGKYKLGARARAWGQAKARDREIQTPCYLRYWPLILPKIWSKSIGLHILKWEFYFQK